VRTLLLLLLAAIVPAAASDYVGVYARIDKVVLEPNATEPEAIQIWGVFSLADPSQPNTYLPPVRGYLYMKIVENKDATLREWNDLKQVASSGEIVSFGSRVDIIAGGERRRAMKVSIRKAGDTPANPDPYHLASGVWRHRNRTDYPPVRRLLDFKD